MNSLKQSLNLWWCLVIIWVSPPSSKSPPHKNTKAISNGPCKQNPHNDSIRAHESRRERKRDSGQTRASIWTLFNSLGLKCPWNGFILSTKETNLLPSCEFKSNIVFRQWHVDLFFVEDIQIVPVTFTTRPNMAESVYRLLPLTRTFKLNVRGIGSQLYLWLVRHFRDIFFLKMSRICMKMNQIRSFWSRGKRNSEMAYWWQQDCVLNHTPAKQIGLLLRGVPILLNHSYDHRPNWTPLSPIIVSGGDWLGSPANFKGKNKGA